MCAIVPPLLDPTLQIPPQDPHIPTDLLYGWADGTSSPAESFERTITIAVQLGYDTDCNGATVGSVIGLVLGANVLPEKWTRPLNDTLPYVRCGIRVTDSHLGTDGLYAGHYQKHLHHWLFHVAQH
jgi:hypothetical protein